MARRRVTAIIAAVLLAIFGTVIILAYVNSQTDRALEGQQVVEVLVAAEEIPAGTSVSELGDRVGTEPVPVALRPDSALRSLDQLDDSLVADANIQAGLPLVEGQFVQPSQAAAGSTDELGAGEQIIAVAVETQRAVGGRLARGDRVGVLISTGVESADQSGESSSDDGDATGQVLTNIEVVEVDGATIVDDAEAAADETLTVSLLVTTEQAERIVFGQEFGRLWLAKHGESAPVLDDDIRTAEDIFSGIPESSASGSSTTEDE